MTTIALIGAPGAGKSTVGRLLARELGVEFVDVDELISDQEGKPIAEIFADDGEPYFRQLEQDLTLKALSGEGVISLGGGAIENAQIREALAPLTVVWLEVSIKHATRRVGMNRARPLLVGNVRGRLVELLNRRTPLYEAAATIKVPTDELTARAVTDQILEALR